MIEKVQHLTNRHQGCYESVDLMSTLAKVGCALLCGIDSQSGFPLITHQT